MAESAGRASRLLGASALMTSGTLVSRVFGAVRVVLTGKVLGIGARQSDLFALAWMIPNSVYIIVASGLANAILVPQLVRAKKDPDGGEAYTNRILTAFFLLFLLVTLACTAVAGPFARLMAGPAWTDDPALVSHVNSLAVLTAFCMPQVFLYGVFVLLSQVLNARGSFGPPMWAPIANNIIQIATIGLYFGLFGRGPEANAQPFSRAQILLLSGGWALGLVAQAAVLIPFARRAGFRYRPRFDLLHTGLAHTFGLAKWSLLFVGVANVALYVCTRLVMPATAEGEGAGKNVYDNAYLIFALPHSLVAVSIATALVPALSAYAARSQMQSFARELSHGVRLTVTAILPLALLLLALGQAIPPLYYRDAEEAAAAGYVGWTLMALAAGLVAFSVQYVFQRAYFAIEDTRSVFVFEVVMAVTWIAGAWALVAVTGHAPAWLAPCMALANAISMWIGLAVTLVHSRRQLPTVRLGPLARHAVRTFLAAAPGAALAWVIVGFQTGHWDGLIADILGLVAACLAAGAVYLSLARFFHLQEIDQVVGLVTAKLRPHSQDAKEDTMAVVNPPRPDGTPPGPQPPKAPDGSFPQAQAGGAADRIMPPAPKAPPAPRPPAPPPPARPAPPPP
ncbi:MAG: murein biosynthesis integral membrane protein MurJ, partial [Propionibacteriaceae bacterium]|nr:murein biosynthesis integral membrane protein MurJ [Propionibacteriaceae bacterium]